MNKVTVSASLTYDILIERGIVSSCADYMIGADISPCRAAILTDDTVDGLYSDTVISSLDNAGFEVVKYVIPHGEASKCADNFIKFLNFLSENQLTRQDVLIALGGGIVGDLCGFCASCYLRGVRFIQIPTTLLAMVDSSVGGKTAIDLDAGKNLAGAFYQPSLVLIDPNTLSTLPEDIFNDGCAEVIKYGIINDRELFDMLKLGITDRIESVIERCVQNKRDIVDRDERDLGTRQLLNLGHTVAHGIEKLSSFTVSHGSAVAIGTAFISRVSVNLGLMSNEDCTEIIKILKNNSLPIQCDHSAHELSEVAMSDKKRKGGYIDLVMPYAIGDSRLYRVPCDKIEEIFSMGYEK